MLEHTYVHGKSGKKGSKSAKHWWIVTILTPEFGVLEWVVLRTCSSLAHFVSSYTTCQDYTRRAMEMVCAKHVGVDDSAWNVIATLESLVRDCGFLQCSRADIGHCQAELE